MAAVHPSAFANSFNIRERARLSRVVAESVERQSSRIEARFDASVSICVRAVAKVLLLRSKPSRGIHNDQPFRSSPSDFHATG